MLNEKLYYKIGEAAEIAAVEPHVLRYWETEFKELRPEKTKTGRRVYTKDNLNLILEIKRLLYEKRFSIEGAKKFLKTGAAIDSNPDHNKDKVIHIIEDIKLGLKDILARLKNGG